MYREGLQRIRTLFTSYQVLFMRCQELLLLTLMIQDTYLVAINKRALKEYVHDIAPLSLSVVIH
jgi:hypothetical protein